MPAPGFAWPSLTAPLEASGAPVLGSYSTAKLALANVCVARSDPGRANGSAPFYSRLGDSLTVRALTARKRPAPPSGDAGGGGKAGRPLITGATPPTTA